jgi:hypothetical protein
MNARIRELALKAGGGLSCIAEPLEHPWKFSERELEKFAELIIRECMACSIWVGKNNTNTVEPVHTAHAINQRIKQQFGVEE